MICGSLPESSACRGGITKTAQRQPRFGLVTPGPPYGVETDAVHHRSVATSTETKTEFFEINPIEYISMIRGSLPKSSACRSGITKTAQRQPRFRLVNPPYGVETDAPSIRSDPHRHAGRVLHDKSHRIHINDTRQPPGVVGMP